MGAGQISMREPAAMQALLRLAVSTYFRLRRAGWFIARPSTVGAHSLALTPDRELILVKLRYRKGWWAPGGGLKRGETPEEGALRELREEVGATRIGKMIALSDFRLEVDFKQDTSSVFIVYDVKFTPSFSFEVEDPGLSFVRPPPGHLPTHANLAGDVWPS